MRRLRVPTPLFAITAWAGLGLAGCAGPDERPATWELIHPALIVPYCATSNCHASLSATAGLILDHREGAYVSLTGRSCGSELQPGDPPRNLVTPGQPESSTLVYLLRGIERRRMPPDLPLPEVDIQWIERWILDGAPCQ